MKRTFVIMLGIFLVCGLLAGSMAYSFDRATYEKMQNGAKDCPGCDLSGANMSGWYLGGANLSGANLCGATWTDGTHCASISVGQCVSTSHIIR